jgi:hypothetical protein
MTLVGGAETAAGAGAVATAGKGALQGAGLGVSAGELLTPFASVFKDNWLKAAAALAASASCLFSLSPSTAPETTAPEREAFGQDAESKKVWWFAHHLPLSSSSSSS